MSNEKSFIVQCNCCGQQFENWSGSTPCCGSIAYVVGEDGKPTKTISLFASLGGSPIQEVKIDTSNKQ